MVGDLTDRSHQSIAAFRYCFDISLIAAVVVETLPQRGDILRQTPFLDEDARPDLLQQSVLVNDLTLRLDQREQGVEHLGWQWYYSAVPEEKFLSGVDPVITKFEQCPVLA
jgi:hypothetical protein